MRVGVVEVERYILQALAIGDRQAMIDGVRDGAERTVIAILRLIERVRVARNTEVPVGFDVLHGGGPVIGVAAAARVLGSTPRARVVIHRHGGVFVAPTTRVGRLRQGGELVFEEWNGVGLE